MIRYTNSTGAGRAGNMPRICVNDRNTYVFSDFIGRKLCVSVEIHHQNNVKYIFEKHIKK